MVERYSCKKEWRKQEIIRRINEKVEPIINGIDYLEIDTDDQKKIYLYFLDSLIDNFNNSKLNKENILISGGTRIKDIIIEDCNINSENKKILKLELDKAGDFSIYLLSIVDSSENHDCPAGFDPQLSSVEFSFKINCPGGFDCKTNIVCQKEKVVEPYVDYLAKDYSSFRRLILDRMNKLMPDWKEKNPADLQIALVEMLAYIGDKLSYYQDAVATEAYLKTARKRVSVRRHARLLDYFVHDGCNSRVWISLEIEKGGSADGTVLPVKTQFLASGVDNQPVLKSDSAELEREDAIVFETMHEITLRSSHNTISFYTWGEKECCLPRGSTSATLINDPELHLNTGDLLIFEEIRSPVTGEKEDANPNNRQIVRLTKISEKEDELLKKQIVEIEWHEKDALAFPVIISSVTDNDEYVEDISVVLGNIVLADHGKTLENQSLNPETFSGDNPYRPELSHKNITFAEKYDHESSKSEPAKYASIRNQSEALPQIKMIYNIEKWEPVKDLLNSGCFDQKFVVEVENDRSVRIRFGDGKSGKKTAEGFKPDVTYRVGNGIQGNIGYDTLKSIIWNMGGILKVRNPLPAIGGIDGESMNQVREFAPEAFRFQERAVTEQDYAEKTEMHQEVQKAAASFRWTGSWYTVFITIDRINGQAVDDAFKKDICRFLEKYRMAGYDLEIKGPEFVPLDILMNVCVETGYYKSYVKQNLINIFSRYDLPNGKRGFFHPDNFTFGQKLHLGAMYNTAIQIPGVVSVEIKKFQRFGKNSANDIEIGFIKPEENEILRLDNDPNFPENGKIDFLMYGGL